LVHNPLHQNLEFLPPKISLDRLPTATINHHPLLILPLTPKRPSVTLEEIKTQQAEAVGVETIKEAEVEAAVAGQEAEVQALTEP
jgi:hypothetical protein